MPCNSDYLEPTIREINVSRVLCLIDELDGKNFNKSHWNGYHPRVYSKGFPKYAFDKLVERLCKKLSKKKDITKYSLEMQLWWRDHQIADKARLVKEDHNKRIAKLRKSALAKLTPEEKDALKLYQEDEDE